MLHFITLILFLGVTSLTQAQELPESFVPVRSNGMGGAFTAIANDENSVWTNPAGIARVRKARSRGALDIIKVPNLAFGANTNSRSFLSRISALGDSTTADTLSSKVNDLAEKPLWASLSTFPLAMVRFGNLPSVIGGYSHTTIKAVIDSENPLQASTVAISDVGGVLGLAITDRSNRINFGINMRYVKRYAYEETLPIIDMASPTELQARIKSNSNVSQAFALDMGFMWTFADFWYPTFGIAIFNSPLGCKDDYLNPFSKTREKVCGTVFSGNIANTDALSTIDPTDIRFGLSMTPRFSRSLAARISAGLHHIHGASGSNNYGLSEVPIQKQIHAGVEIFTGNPLLPPPFSVSFGYNQGFYSMGFTVRMPFISFDVASYGRDISTTDSPTEDRRIMVGFSIDM